MRDDLPICATCGQQYGAAREDCPVCLDQRQYVPAGGQRWTSLAELTAAGHRGRVEEEDAGLYGVGAVPEVGIGQRALLVPSPSGNVLWDCFGYIDAELIDRVIALGGVSAIAVSHPHFYGAMVEWAHAFNAPVYLHAADREWVGRPDDAVVFWEGDTLEIGEGLTLINAGVHFAGGQVLHARDASDGRGGLFSGDIVHVVADQRWVSFMYSFPNFIPERPRAIRRALELLAPFRFERVYGAWWRRIVDSDGVAALRRSADRYLDFALDDEPSTPS
jgi:glyoxylase-like metal-dependent hydrolase (beta-lactamase superfamily II)